MSSSWQQQASSARLPLFGAAPVLVAAVLLWAGPLAAVTPQQRPMARPLPDAASAAPLPAAEAGESVPAATAIAAPAPPRPKARPEGFERIARAAEAARQEDFRRWLRAFRGRALARGIPAAVFDRALAGVRYDRDVVRRDRSQAEFGRAIWDYLDSAVSDERIAEGRAALHARAGLLSRIEARYGVDKEIVVAIWGIETSYGTRRGENDVIGALATLAYDGRRGRFFEQQLVAALQILQSGDVAPEAMTGSWAGAMGHTQFIPTTYLAHAVDFDGDGRRDIWSDDPADALASTAAYLKRFGWIAGQPWGVEVTLPEGFDFALVGRRIRKSPAEWAALGIRGTDGRPVPNYGAASIRLPAGASGAAFMTFRNFDVIARYNAADAYVIAVGHLADRLRGEAALKAEWPRGDRMLSLAERRELQRRLTAQGFDTQGIDGRIGPRTLAAIRDYQRAAGLVPDGYASLHLLNRLR